MWHTCALLDTLLPASWLFAHSMCGSFYTSCRCTALAPALAAIADICPSAPAPPQESDEGDAKLEGVSGFTQQLLSKHMQAMDSLFAEDNEYARRSRWQDKNWASEDTDTRFETESDMMELCDLAEILYVAGCLGAGLCCVRQRSAAVLRPACCSALLRHAGGMTA